MNIAWTSLFHAIFHYKKENYFYKDPKNPRHYVKIDDGRKKAWELGKCVEVYFKNCNKKEKPIKANFDFFIPIRNEIEHAFLPELDDDIFGECQSYLHNFEYILSKEFGEEHKINETLNYAIQFSETYYHSKKIKSKDYELLKNKIIKFREKLPDEIYFNNRFRFQAALVPINNPNKADVAIKFINKDEITSENQQKIDEMLYIIDEKKFPVSDLDMVKSGEVSKEIAKRLSEHYKTKITFSPQHHHNKCCIEYKCRSPDKNVKKPLNSEFCNYNEAFDDYTYSRKWIEYLFKKLSSPEELLRLFPKNTKKIMNLYTAMEVIKILKKELTTFYEKPIPFWIKHHNKCLEYYKCKYKVDEETFTDDLYCIYTNNKYYYTQDWVDFLTDELTCQNKIEQLFPNLLND